MTTKRSVKLQTWATKAKRLQARKAALPSQAAENRYVRGLKSLLREATAPLKAYLKAHLSDVAKRTDARHTKSDDEIDALRKVAEQKLRAGVVPLFDKMSSQVKATGAKAFKKLVGVTPNDARIAGQLAVIRQKNVDLVTNTGNIYMREVQNIFSNPDTYGMRVEELAELLAARAGVSESRAELIARDQTLKTNAAVTQTRHENAGITAYIWSTSNDERVRDEHAELEGQQFDYSAPPEPGNPGEDFQCRCVSLPVLEEFSGIF